MNIQKNVELPGHSFLTKKTTFRTFAAYGLLLSVIGYFYFLILRFQVNFPLYDDFSAILPGARMFDPHISVLEKLKYLFGQHNEHRIAYSRTVVFLVRYLTGKLDFRLLTFIGSLHFIGFFLIFHKSAKCLKSKIMPVYAMIPAAFLLFQLQFWNAIFLTSSALSIVPVCFFAFL